MEIYAYLLLSQCLVWGFVSTAVPVPEDPPAGRSDGFCGRILRAQSQGTRRDGYNEFRLRVEGDPETYQPGSTYRVVLLASSPAFFRGFMLIALKEGREGTEEGHYAGQFQIVEEDDTQFMTFCPPAVTESTPRRRTRIQVLWTAPPAGTGCVVLKASIVQRRVIYFQEEGSLTVRLCEKEHVPGEATLPPALECCACGTAKYRLTFYGNWSEKIHPKDYPRRANHWSALIGASHTQGYALWEYGGYASEGVRQVAELGSPIKMEEEIRQKVSLPPGLDLNYPYEDHSGSLRLITIKPMTAQPTYSYPSSSSHSQDSVVLNGEANHNGLKQKSDIEHYRNKLRQKARRKGYGEFSLSGSGSHAHGQRDARHGRHENGLKEPMTAEEKRASFAGCHKRYSHPREPAYWSRQSLSSPSPVETEMDLLVLRERSRRGIRNNGYDGEAEPFEETNVDRLMTSLGFGGTGSTRNGSLGVKGHRGSDSSTLSSQPSIDEVRSQMHMLLGNAFSLAPPEHDPPSHHRYHPHAHTAYNPSHTAPYCGGVTSAPGTMNHPCGGRQRSAPGYGDMHQCSLPKPGFRFTQLPDMGIGSPPPLIPSRPGPPPGTSVRRSTPDMSLKPRAVTEASDLQNQQHNGAPYLPLSRAPFPAVTVDQSITNYSGNPMTAVYAISANRPGYSDYYVMSPPSSYRSPSWMSYPPEPEDLPRQWSDTPPWTPGLDPGHHFVELLPSLQQTLAVGYTCLNNTVWVVVMGVGHEVGVAWGDGGV
ncbi:unnamed protein product [Merluccius merluccius]